jgi:nucleoside diphosphate kinase
MKKLICIIALLCAVSVQADAQSLKDILSGAVKQVVGDKATTETSLIGTWTYVGPDCQLKGDDLLKNIGGDAAGVEVEKKMVSIYEKSGLNTIQYTFNEDKTCSYTIKGKKVEGTYVFDPEAKTITIQAGRLKVKTVAHVVTLGSNMSFVFDANKIFSVVKTITGATSSLNASASAINKLLDEFDGMMVGFELKKQ